ncbi:Dps family protein [Halobacteriovorax sp. JY17]|uniref:Dps family protein n=1 Tax=Halobacteriovorax sp. JY17 TaxID=2014617 RepID=UPI000C40DAB4|nr:Dps family protein [Halobacteriovorax sp. JY17]PIK16414.1 MAG: DNA starvation/stationary phase protection protein [Halobacteriovorax sp. JY17]
MSIKTGINESKKNDIAAGLSKLLAETYTLYLKTHKYHWNVTGPMFQSLHTMFEVQYTELALAVDEIAERIRVLDFKAPGSYTEYSKLSSVKEDEQLDRNSNEMIVNLLSDHEQVVRTAKEILPLLENANDEGTNSLLGGRIEYHEKTAWMLKSLLG